MVKKDRLRLFMWIEVAIWIMIFSIAALGIRHYRVKHFKSQVTHQIFLPDVYGLIVGSPVKYMGVEIGYIDAIKIVGSDVYVRFVISEKDVKLPRGVVATVEFYGLGGSKTLELYPPTQDSIASKKIIAVQQPTRIADVFILLNEMFAKIDSIGQRFSVFATETESLYPKSKGAVHVDEIQENMNLLDVWVNEYHQKRIGDKEGKEFINE